MKAIIVLVALALVSGCAHQYATPGAGASLALPASPDQDRPGDAETGAGFPARIAMARVQTPGYYTKGSKCAGSGKYCVVTTRELETDADIERLARMPMVAGLVPVGPPPDSLQSYADLRGLAENLKADILLLYSVNTVFSVGEKAFQPADVIALGLLPKKNTQVSSTVSALLMDVRTGFIYGAADATASEDNKASAWTTTNAIDAARLRTEIASFQRLLAELEKLWADVIKAHAGEQK